MDPSFRLSDADLDAIAARVRAGSSNPPSHRRSLSGSSSSSFASSAHSAGSYAPGEPADYRTYAESYEPGSSRDPRLLVVEGDTNSNRSRHSVRSFGSRLASWVYALALFGSSKLTLAWVLFVGLAGDLFALRTYCWALFDIIRTGPGLQVTEVTSSFFSMVSPGLFVILWNPIVGLSLVATVGYIYWANRGRSALVSFMSTKFSNHVRSRYFIFLNGVLGALVIGFTSTVVFRLMKALLMTIKRKLTTRESADLNSSLNTLTNSLLVGGGALGLLFGVKTITSVKDWSFVTSTLRRSLLDSGAPQADDWYAKIFGKHAQLKVVAEKWRNSFLLSSWYARRVDSELQVIYAELEACAHLMVKTKQANLDEFGRNDECDFEDDAKIYNYSKFRDNVWSYLEAGQFPDEARLIRTFSPETKSKDVASAVLRVLRARHNKPTLIITIYDILRDYKYDLVLAVVFSMILGCGFWYVQNARKPRESEPEDLEQRFLKKKDRKMLRQFSQDDFQIYDDQADIEAEERKADAEYEYYERYGQRDSLIGETIKSLYNSFTGRESEQEVSFDLFAHTRESMIPGAHSIPQRRPPVYTCTGSGGIGSCFPVTIASKLLFMTANHVCSAQNSIRVVIDGTEHDCNFVASCGDVAVYTTPKGYSSTSWKISPAPLINQTPLTLITPHAAKPGHSGDHTLNLQYGPMCQATYTSSASDSGSPIAVTLEGASFVCVGVHSGEGVAGQSNEFVPASKWLNQLTVSVQTFFPAKKSSAVKPGSTPGPVLSPGSTGGVGTPVASSSS